MGQRRSRSRSTRPTSKPPRGGPAFVTPHVSTVKIGLELYLRYGPDVVATVRGASGVQVFLDLKLHDIPATVAGAARAVARLRPEFLTVHAASGPTSSARPLSGARTCVAAVTVLTSMGDEDLAAARHPGHGPRHGAPTVGDGGRGGRRGLVCSPHEVAAVRAEVGPEVTLITPGVRPAGRRPTTRRAWRPRKRPSGPGADLLVIGRPITRAPIPVPRRRR